MIEALKEMLSGNPILLLFLVLTIGFLIGGTRFGAFQLGPVAGVSLAGLLFGHLGFESNAAIQSFGFVLFMIAVGYQAGPRFIQALGRAALPGNRSDCIPDCHKLAIEQFHCWDRLYE